MIKILDDQGAFVQLDDRQSDLLFAEMAGPRDPSVSSCTNCRSCVIAAEPFNEILDDMTITHIDESELLGALIELVENSESVHLYILEDNECVHTLWRDPLAGEWSAVTREKRLHS